jgi:hypothetical protein
MLKMPDDFRGDVLNGSEYVKTAPRKWTDKELQWVVQAKENGFSNAEIANATGRSEVSIFVKLKRLSKRNDTYNVKHRDMKYLANASFLELLEPKTVLDVYAGHSWWDGRVDWCISNDIDQEFPTHYHEDALSLLVQLWQQNEKFDVIDLDPYGSAYECFDFALRLATKGLVVSFGEWGHKRWKRFDFVGPRYGIANLEDFVAEKFIDETRRIARLHKKELTVVDALQYGNFLRVYFSIQKRKETSQWDDSIRYPD